VVKKKTGASIPYLLLTPALALLILLILIPGIWALFLSLTKYAPGLKPVYVGLKNYVDIVKDPHLLNALFNNIIFLAAVICFEFLVGFGSALLLNHKFPLQKLWIALVIAPYAISPVVSCVIWRYILDPNYGLANYIFSVVGLSKVCWFGSATLCFIPIIITDVWKYAPFTMVIGYAALTSLPPELFEAANIDGAKGLQIFRYLTLPLVAPALFVAVVFRIIFAFREFGIIWILTKGGPSRGTEILSVYLYKESFRYFHFGRGSTIALFMSVTTIFLSIHIVKKMYRRMF